MLKYILITTLVCMCFHVNAQTDSQRVQTDLQRIQADTIPHADTASIRPAPADTFVQRQQTVPLPVIKLKKPLLLWRQDTAFTRFFQNHQSGSKPPVFMIVSVREPVHSDVIFYMLAGLFLLAGISRAAFPKYFSNLFRLFFQSSYRQKQSRENAAQHTLPSLFFNIIFFLSWGLFIAIIASNAVMLQSLPFWLLWIYTCGLLTIVYCGKFLFISFCGWVFNVHQLALNYNFIVFLCNKIAGIVLLPLLLLLAYSSGSEYNILITVIISLVVAILIYRYILALSVVGKNLHVQAIHFFIYLCAVEILPLLIIYKLLFTTLGK